MSEHEHLWTQIPEIDSNEDSEFVKIILTWHCTVGKCEVIRRKRQIFDYSQFSDEIIHLNNYEFWSDY